MLPGTLCDGRVFARQRRALRGAAEVVVPHYHDLRDVPVWVHALLRRLPARFSVAGFSLGGIVALEMLRQAPERVERLAMLASNAQPGSPAGRRKGATMWKTLRSQGAVAVVEPALPGYFHLPAHAQRHADLVRDMARATPVRAARAQFAWAGTRPDGLAALSRFKGPLLLMSGAHDRLSPPAWQRAMVQAQPAARWLALPRTGHFVTLEAPSRVSDGLRRWLGAETCHVPGQRGQ